MSDPEASPHRPALRLEPGSRILDRSFYDRPPLAVAADLLGRIIETGDGRRARLTEVEAYGGTDDPASHAYRGPTRRTATMWGPPGHLYVYFTYGMHWCANATCGSEGLAGAVLLRAAEPLAGLDAMRAARWRTQRHQPDRDLCRGPARLCQAMGWVGSFDGADLTVADRGVRIVDDGDRRPQIRHTGRVGLRVATDWPWRLVVDGSPWSSPDPRPAHVRSADVGPVEPLTGSGGTGRAG